MIIVHIEPAFLGVPSSANPAVRFPQVKTLPSADVVIVDPPRKSRAERTELHAGKQWKLTYSNPLKKIET